MTSPTPPSSNNFGSGPTNSPNSTNVFAGSGSSNPPNPPLPPVSTSNSTQAIIALVLGILSMPCFCGFITGIPAIIVGHLELKAIREGRSATSNQGLAKWGFVLGIIGTVISCLVGIAYIVLIAIGVKQEGGLSGPSTF